MTVSPDTRPLAPASVTSALGVLRAGGLRISAARRLVLEALFAAEAPVTADEIASGLGGRLPGSDLAPLYRNLETLAAAGLVEHVHARARPRALRADRPRRRRLGDVRGAAARIERLERGRAAGLREAVRAATGFEAAFGHFPLVGAAAGAWRRAS